MLSFDVYAIPSRISINLCLTFRFAGHFEIFAGLFLTS